jgi:hypothetical protein
MSRESVFIAAGQAMLAEGQSRSGILIIEFACLVIAAVMLSGKVFSKATACAGILGNVLLMVVEIHLLLAQTLLGAWMIIAGGAGLSIMTWYFLIGRRLLQLGAHLK